MVRVGKKRKEKGGAFMRIHKDVRRGPIDRLPEKVELDEPSFPFYYLTSKGQNEAPLGDSF